MLSLLTCGVVLTIASVVADGVMRSAAAAMQDLEEKIASFSSGDSSFTLKKTVYSNQTRLFIAAGLEGTGHHALQSMLKVCGKTHPALCEPHNAISLRTMSFNKKQDVVKGLFGAADTSKAIEDIEVIAKEMAAMVELPESHLYFLGLGWVKTSGHYSYPNFQAKYKTLDHPDVFILAMIAESMGLDYRVLVLQRDGADIMASTKRRKFGKGSNQQTQSRIMQDNAAVLYSQLLLLDPRFYHCVQYSELSSFSREQKNAFAGFLHPDMLKDTAVVDRMFEKVYKEKLDQRNHKDQTVQTTGKRRLQYHRYLLNTSDLYSDLTSYDAFHLHARLSLIDNLCRKAESE